ncbi:MAG: tetratricopeptide repeat protein [Planctomycetales bacterium]|nr:tetratricopeptide repeat protein [Planctomycetales bacterium]
MKDEAYYLAQALNLETEKERQKYLTDVCGEDKKLRAELEHLLNLHSQAGSFLERPPPSLDFPTSTQSNFSGRSLAAYSSVLKHLECQLDTVPRVNLRQLQDGDGPIIRPAGRSAGGIFADGRYEVSGEIARGGMGAIHRAMDRDLGRDLAIKVLLEEHADKPEVQRRFIEEAQIGGQLQHPGITPVYELGQLDDQRPFFTMKLVKGRTLSALLSERQDPAEDRARFIGIFEQICQAMAYSHSRGVIHRDLKPANIMVGAFGEVQVMDWGLAKVLQEGGIADERKERSVARDASAVVTVRSSGSDTADGAGSQTQVGSILGTPSYLPPEQALGNVEEINERSDVFGLGAILCVILTGDPPYVADSGTRIFILAQGAKLDDCFARLDGCGADAELIGLAKHCLQPEAKNRPRNAGVLQDRVAAYIESVDARLRATELARAAGEVRVEEERKRRKIQLALVSTLLMLIGLGGGGWAYVQQQAADRLAIATANINDKLNDARLHQKLAAAFDLSSSTDLTEHARELQLALASAQESVRLTEQHAVLGPLQATAKQLRDVLDKDYQSAEQAASQVARDQALQTELERIRLTRASSTNAGTESSALLYHKAFQNAGLNLSEVTLSQAIEWANRSTIRETLVSSLDDWIRELEHVDDAELLSLSLEQWITPQVMNIFSDSCEFSQRADGSILAGPPRIINRSTYTIELQPGKLEATHLRLDALRDAALPNGGAGHHSTGSFQVTEIEALVIRDDAKPVHHQFTHAIASYSWPERPISGVIDGDPKTGWHVWERIEESHHAILKFESPVLFENTDRLVIKIHQTQDHSLGCFRLSLKPAFGVRNHIEKHLQFVAAIDDNVWRRNLRTALLESDTETLEALISDVELRWQSPTLIAWLGAALRQSNRSGEAVEILKRSQAFYPDDFWINFELANCLQELGNSDEGLGFLRAAVASRPDSMIALLNLADVLEKLHEYESLRYVLKKVSAMDPSSANWHIQIGLRFRRSRMRNEATEEFRQASQIDPTNVRGIYNLAIELRDQQDMNSAIPLFRKAIELDPFNTGPYFALGVAYHRMGNYDAALTEFRRAAQVEPTYAHLHTNIGYVLSDQGKIDEAMEAWRQATLADSLVVTPFVLRGSTFHDRGHFDEAIAEYRKALNNDQRNSDLRRALGLILHEKGDFNEAILEYQRALETAPKNLVTRLCLAYALNAAGRIHEANDAVSQIQPEEISDVYMSDLFFLLSLFEPNSSLDQFQASLLSLIRQCCSSDSNNPLQRKALALASFRMQHWNEVKELLQASDSRDDFDAVGDWLLLAMTHWHVGELPQAKELFDRASAWRTSSNLKAQQRRLFQEATTLFDTEKFGTDLDSTKISN